MGAGHLRKVQVGNWHLCQLPYYVAAENIRTVNGLGRNAMSGMSRFFYQNRSTATITGTQNSQRFIWGSGVILAFQNLQAAARCLFASDSSGSVIATALKDHLMSQRYTVSGFSKLDIRDAAGAIAFKGYYWDSMLEAYALGRGYRYYNPILMRFMKVDDLSPFGTGGVNAYAYCEGDPLNFHDADGTTRHRLPQLLMHPQSKVTPPASPQNATQRSQAASPPNLSLNDIVLPDDFQKVLASSNESLQSPVPGPVGRSVSAPARVEPYPATASRDSQRSLPQPSPELLALAKTHGFTDGDRGAARMAFDSLYPGLTVREKRQKIRYLKSQLVLRKEMLMSQPPAHQGAIPPTSGAISNVRRTSPKVLDPR